MFTRAVELTGKSGKSRDLSNAINEQVVPMLKSRQALWMRSCSSLTRSAIACWL